MSGAPEGMEVVGWMVFNREGQPWMFAATSRSVAEKVRAKEASGALATEAGPFTLRPVYARVGPLPEEGA